MKYYIKERINPQTGTYYVDMGKMSVKDAKKHETPIYGTNIMHDFKSKKEYNEALIKWNVKSKES